MDEEAITADHARQGVRPSLVNKNFLNSNATSHEWAFGAVAEILDNAMDPDVLATQFWLDVETIGNEKCLVFTDNGRGMDNKTLYRMLSFGFSEKEEVNGHKPIGRYGNGFKSGSMRLAKDAVVFTMQHKNSMSVGMLSQSYLNKIKSETVVVPIVTWDGTDGTIEYPVTNEKKSLNEIMKHSIFKTEDKLLDQIYKIPPRKNKHQGTRIVLYNLAREKSGKYELDLDSDPHDILIPTSQEVEQFNGGKDKSKSVSKYRMSLRKYISILYLRPRMQVMLKSKKVTCICLLKCISNKKRFIYTPKKITNEPIMIDFGLNPEQDEYGITIYHRNRLIQPFRKNNFMKKALPENVQYNQIRPIIEQAIGVVELNCVTPNHIKQNFQDDTTFRNIDQNLFNRLFEYCLEILESNEARNNETDLWVQCSYPDCQKWRRLPHGIRKENIPDVWFCMMNPDMNYNFCEANEEEEEETEIHSKRRRNSVFPDAPSPGKSTGDDETEDVEARRPAEMPDDMRGFLTKIMSQPGQPTPRKKRKHTNGAATPNKRLAVGASSNLPSIPSTSAEPFPNIAIKQEGELKDSEIRRLRMELDSKQARIAELEQTLEKANNQNTQNCEKSARVESLVARYLTKIWPDYSPNEVDVEFALQQLVDQMEALQQANSEESLNRG